MHTLYIIPGACSLGPHILLRELDLPHDVEVVDLAEDAPGFSRINPRGKVPALRTDDGTIITEQLGIDSYLAALRPERGLLPDSPLDRARVYEALGFANSVAHPHFGQMVFPQRYVEGDEAKRNEFRAGARRRFLQSLEQLEGLIVGPFLLGERFCAADPYLYVMCRWAEASGFDMSALPRLAELGRAVLARPTTQQVLTVEGLA